MIVVRVEMHSGITGQVREIGRVEIANDETGPSELGNYDVTVVDDTKVTRRGRVEKYNRRQPIWSLVQFAISSALEVLPVDELTRKLSLERCRSSIFLAEIKRDGRKHIDVHTHASLNDEDLPRVALLDALITTLTTAVEYYQSALDAERSHAPAVET